jgi:TetR/AcrR family transcriptional regulator, fatty acid metabolism regulator protein
MPMPLSQARTRIRHERILDAALTVFSSRGYRDAAVDDIATEADTSKGGIYFHFPGKQAIFLALLDRSANLLLNRIVESVDAEPDPIAKVDVALHVLLHSFASHRVLARVFLVEALGAGPEFNAKMNEIHGRFAILIKGYLDEAVRRGLIPPLDTDVASLAWFGALNQVVIRWILEARERPLEDAYLTLRTLLLRSIGAPADLTAHSEGIP